MSFLLKLEVRRCYIVKAYVPPNNVPAMHCVEHVMITAPKGLEIIVMGELNTRLGDPRDKREEDCQFLCSQNCETWNFFAQNMPETVD